MKVFVLALVLCATAVFAEFSDDEEEAWSSFKVQFGKAFLSKNTEKRRKRAFMENREKVKKLHQAKEAGEINYEPKIYAHHDLTDDEFVSRFGGLEMVDDVEVPEEITDFVSTRQNLPSSFDSRAQGWIGPIKQQGNCNSCWAFSALCCIEAGYAIAKKPGLDLSEQQMVDCAKFSCDPAAPDLAFTYIEKNGGVTSESAYPYTGVCSSCKTQGGAWRHTNRVNINKDPDSIKAAIMELGALQIAVDCQAWSTYGKGVYDGHVFRGDKGRGINHGVNVVGWGADKGGEYWIVRNSWGTDWGENGYIRVATTPDGGYNTKYTWAIKV